MRSIRRVAVLGAGTMGSRIAAHFANAGIPSRLLDIVIAGANRNAAALKGIENAATQKPGAFFIEAAKTLITPGNFEDDLDKIADCDWIIEAVTENLDIKRSLWRRVELIRNPAAILSTNTSGISLARICEGFSPEFRRNFLGTHFFNPPRYLHLMELIPGPGTDTGMLAFVRDFAEQRLGKGVVDCKDTPNFIANRIGAFLGATVMKYMLQGDYSIEEVDALTGHLIGLPNSASFRLLDIVGLDVWDSVLKNLYHSVPDDTWRERFRMPEFAERMLERKWLGEKTGQGFYRRVGKDREIQVLDWKTLEYRPLAKPAFPSVEAARGIEDLGQRLQNLVRGNDRAGYFLWNVLSDLFLYSAEMIPEIAERTVEIDRAMRWGYAHKLGPFELWDALGFEAVLDRLESERRYLSVNIEQMRAADASSFYDFMIGKDGPERVYFDLIGQYYRKVPARPGVLALADVKRAKGVMRQNAGASLVDLEDGVLCVEFHSKVNALGQDQIEMMQEGLRELEANFEAMLIANEGENFSAGANLMLVLMAAQEGEWDELNEMVYRFQQMNLALKYALKPVVSAPFARTFGGACEIVLHSAASQASAELYMGLVEVGVGLIPAGGGCKELLARLKDPRRIFELIGMAKVSTSAADAKQLGLLRASEPVSMNPERLLADAKALALVLARDYVPRTPEAKIKTPGEAGFAALKIGFWSMRQAGHISDYDACIGEKLAYVLSGGRITGEQTVSEQYLLDLEREAFLSLCGNAKTQERMAHMLKTGKALRN